MMRKDASQKEVKRGHYKPQERPQMRWFRTGWSRRDCGCLHRSNFREELGDVAEFLLALCHPLRRGKSVELLQMIVQA